MTSHDAALRALDASLVHTTWQELYDVALRAVRMSHPSACAVLLEADAERLGVRRSDGRFGSKASRLLAARISMAPLDLDRDDLTAIEQGPDEFGRDPLRVTLERRLRLTSPAVGRLRLDGIVVALIVLDHSPYPATTADRRFVDEVAERISVCMDSRLGAFLASLHC